MSRIAVIGAGYVGLTSAACFSELGNHVYCLDIDEARLRRLAAGEMPFFEAGLKEVVERNLEAGRLHFGSSYQDALSGAEFCFIAVNTPEGADGAPNLSYVRSAARSIAQSLTGELIVINKSTVPIGTGDLVFSEIAQLQSEHAVHVVSNPEFLREGAALQDFMHPSRVVIGARDREAAEKVAELYRSLGAPIVITDLASAEMIKYASNAFLATRISFINEVARICERVGADVRTVAQGMGHDPRIGPHFLDAGIGFGGSCFPKDLHALAALGEQYGYHPELLEAVDAINRDMRQVAVAHLRDCLGRLEGRQVGLLGLAFKPGTDDLREAPSLELVRLLQEEAARVRAYDPQAMERAELELPELDLCADAYEVAEAADAVVLVTEWPEFRHLDLARLRSVMRTPVLIDGRNLYDPDRCRQLGFVYRGIGRGR